MERVHRATGTLRYEFIFFRSPGLNDFRLSHPFQRRKIMDPPAVVSSLLSTLPVEESASAAIVSRLKRRFEERQTGERTHPLPNPTLLCWC
jgi:hypothetical protein